MLLKSFSQFDGNEKIFEDEKSVFQNNFWFY